MVRVYQTLQENTFISFAYTMHTHIPFPDSYIRWFIHIKHSLQWNKCSKLSLGKHFVIIQQNLPLHPLQTNELNIIYGLDTFYMLLFLFGCRYGYLKVNIIFTRAFVSLLACAFISFSLQVFHFFPYAAAISNF